MKVARRIGRHATNVSFSARAKQWHLSVSSGGLAATTGRNVLASLVMELKIWLWFSKESDVFFLVKMPRKSGWHFTTMLASQGKAQWSHLCISSAKPAATTQMSIISSLVIESETWVVFKGKFVFWS